MRGSSSVMDPQFQELAKEIADAVEGRVVDAVEKRLSGAFEERIKTHINEFEQRAELRMRMHFENLDSKVTLAAEGYGATLQKIERGLAELNKKVDTTFADHTLILADHNRRITGLKQPRG
jgi:hypothetical protein